MAVNVVTVLVCASRTMNNLYSRFQGKELASSQVIVLQQYRTLNVVKPRLRMKMS